MFCNRKRKAKRGFILIYVLLIGCICIAISLGCYAMEMNVRSNSLMDYKRCLEVDEVEKYREYLLTELNKRMVEIASSEENDLEENKHYLEGIRIYFEECCIYYDRDMDCFKAEYIFDGKFYKEETYEYELKGGEFVYSCVDYSFQRGV